MAQGVGPFVELPLWVPAEDAGFNNFAIGRALDAGLTFRPVDETISDTLAWLATRPVDHTWRAGLSAEREAELLQLWHCLLYTSDAADARIQGRSRWVA